MSGDVLEKSDSWEDLGDDAFDVRPEVPWIGFALAQPRLTEWLTRVASSDDSHSST
jgi:hypothetical protein